MYLRSEHKGTITSAHDERITPIGHFLRKYSSMKSLNFGMFLSVKCRLWALAGRAGYADRLQGEARKILELLPGITGPASLYFRDEERILAEAENPRSITIRYLAEKRWK